MKESGLPTVRTILDVDLNMESAGDSFDLFAADPSKQNDRRINVCPADGFDICVGDYPPAPTPDTVPTENPLGTCRCDGEWWVSQGCSYGWRCGMDGNPGDFLICSVSYHLYKLVTCIV